MRYLVALIIGIGALFGVNAVAGIFSLPRPWNSLTMGATVGITMVVVLLVWELVKPSNKDGAPAKPAMSEEERAKARAERRSRLAAEAGVSLDDTESGEAAAEPKAADTEPNAEDSDAESKSAGQDAAPEASPEADESSIEAEPESGDDSRDQENAGDLEQDEPDTRAAAEPETLAPDEYDEEATGSSLESPPTGEPGISVDALEDAESPDTDGASDDDPVGDEPEDEGPDPKR